MKAHFGFTILLLALLLPAGYLSAQISRVAAGQTTETKRQQRKNAELARVTQVNELMKESDFVLEPNQLCGFNVNPATNFVMVAGDVLVFQTSSPADRTRANIPFTDKTVMGRITSEDITLNPKGYRLIKYRMMTEVGVGFRIDIRISPNGNASASVTQNNGAGRLDYQGTIADRGQSLVSVGAESIDLAGFPWFYNFYRAAFDGRE